MPVNVRRAIPEDSPHLMELERLAPTAAHWGDEEYRLAIEPVGNAPERIVLVATSGDSDTPGYKAKIPALSQRRRQAWGTEQIQRRGTPVGFLVALHVGQEWELENVVVAPEFRGQGIGAQLIEALLARVRATNSSAVFLEVRESNAAARKLYKNAGFQETGRRKLYYSHPAECAVLYCKNLV